MTNPTEKVIINPTEKLRERIAQISIGYTEEHHIYIDKDGLAMGEILQACKESGLKFVPDIAFSLPPTAQGTVTIMPIESPIKEIEL